MLICETKILQQKYKPPEIPPKSTQEKNHKIISKNQEQINFKVDVNCFTWSLKENNFQIRVTNGKSRAHKLYKCALIKKKTYITK